jgi:hypothetical protein
MAFAVCQHHAQAHLRLQRRECCIQVHACSRGIVVDCMLRRIDFARCIGFAAPCFREPGGDHDALQPAIEGRGHVQLAHRTPCREEHLLRKVITQRGLPAEVVHELAHARLPAPHQLGDRETAFHGLYLVPFPWSGGRAA